MAINRVQFAGKYSPAVLVGGNSSATITVSKSFPSHVTAGNLLVIVVGAGVDNVAGISAATPVVTDSLGDTYTQACWADGGDQDGGAIGVFIATAAANGACTVTFAYTGACTLNVAGFFDAGIDILEYSGFISPTVQDTAIQQIFGAAGNAPISLSITDSHGASVSVSYSGPSGGGGVGTDAAIVLVDIADGGTDWLIGGCRAYNSTENLPVTTPAGYATFTQVVRAARPDAGDYLYCWDAGAAPVVVQGWLVVNEPSLGLTNRSSYLHMGGAGQHTFTLQIRQRGSASYTLVVSAADSYEPTIGTPIYLYDQNAGGYELVFSGLLQDFTNRWTGIAGDRYIDCTATSLEAVFDTVYASPLQFVNETCGAIVTALFDAFEIGCPVDIGTVQSGATLPLFTTNYEKLSDLFDQLATTSGFTWGVNPQTSELYFCLPTAIPAPFTLSSPEVLWDTLNEKFDGADYRNRQAVRVSYDALPHSMEFFVGAGQTQITLARPVKQVTNAWATLSTPNTATGSFSGNPSAGDTVTIGPASGAWQALHIYGLGGVIVVGAFVFAVTTAGTSGSSQPNFAANTVTGDTVVDATVIWTCNGPLGLSTGSQTYTFVASLDNTQFGQVLIGATAATTCQNLMDAINANAAERGVTISLPTWECAQCNAINRVSASFTLQQKPAGTGYVADLSTTSSAFAWSAPVTSGGTSPQGSLGPNEGATISLQVYAAGTSVAAPGLAYTDGSAIVNLATPLNVGSNLNIEYTRADGDVIEVENTASVATMAALTHGTGKYQQITDASSTGLIATSAAGGLQFAQEALAAYDTFPTEIELQLLQPGLLPGQELTIALSGVLGTAINGTYYIEELRAEIVPTWPWMDSIPAPNAGHYKYTIRLINVAQIASYMDFWEGMGGGGAGGGSGQGAALVATSGGALTTVGQTIIPGKYKTSWTGQTSVTVTHNLGTTDLLFQVFDSSGNPGAVETATFTSSNVLTITFGAAFTGRIVVIG